MNLARVPVGVKLRDPRATEHVERVADSRRKALKSVSTEKPPLGVHTRAPLASPETLTMPNASFSGAPGAATVNGTSIRLKSQVRLSAAREAPQ